MLGKRAPVTSKVKPFSWAQVTGGTESCVDYPTPANLFESAFFSSHKIYSKPLTYVPTLMYFNDKVQLKLIRLYLCVK